MTVIVAKRTRNGFDIAWDSFVGSVELDRSSRELPNVTKRMTGKDCTFLATGDLSHARLFHEYAKKNSVKSSKMVSSILNLGGKRKEEKALELEDVYRFLKGFKKFKKDLTNNEDLNLQTILIVDDKLYQVDCDSCMAFECEDFLALGAGMDVARTVLYLGKCAKKACEVACEISPHCSLPVHIDKIKLNKENKND